MKNLGILTFLLVCLLMISCKENAQNQTKKTENQVPEKVQKASKEKTVLLSTHIMQEVEAICNRVLIINEGIIVADNTLTEINSVSADKYITVSVEFDTEPDDALLKKIPGIIEIQTPEQKTRLIKSTAMSDIRPMLFNFAVEHKMTVLSMQRIEKSMEKIFRELTKK